MFNCRPNHAYFYRKKKSTKTTYLDRLSREFLDPFVGDLRERSIDRLLLSGDLRERSGERLLSGLLRLGTFSGDLSLGLDGGFAVALRRSLTGDLLLRPFGADRGGEVSLSQGL